MTSGVWTFIGVVDDKWAQAVFRRHDGRIFYATREFKRYKYQQDAVFAAIWAVRAKLAGVIP